MIDLKKLIKKITKQSNYSHILTKVVLGNNIVYIIWFVALSQVKNIAVVKYSELNIIKRSILLDVDEIRRGTD